MNVLKVHTSLSPFPAGPNNSTEKEIATTIDLIKHFDSFSAYEKKNKEKARSDQPFGLIQLCILLFGDWRESTQT